jgi:MscS family membrane protein
MQTFVDVINRYLTILGVPGTRVLGVAGIVALAVVVGRLFSPAVVRYIRRLVQRIDGDLDPDLIDRLRKPVGWLIFLAGLRIAYLVVAEFLGSEISQTIDEAMGFATIVVVALLIYRSSSLLAEVMRRVALRSETAIDDLPL